MPTYEYFCQSCKSLFEEILIDPSDVKQFSDWYPCNKCHEMAARVPISVTNFSFKEPARPVQGSGVHGQSGSHDLDYPTLDKAIGRSSEKKWAEFNRRKAERDQIRKDAGTNSLSTAGGNVAPADPGIMKHRETGLRTMSKAKKTAKKV